MKIFKIKVLLNSEILFFLFTLVATMITLSACRSLEIIRQSNSLDGTAGVFSSDFC